MINETRNELLTILYLIKADNNKEKEYQLTYLLERFENDINRQLKDLKSKEEELESNLATLNYVREQLEKESE